MTRIAFLTVLFALFSGPLPARAMDMPMDEMSMGGKAAPPPPVAGHRLGGPFALTDQDGRAVTDHDFPGFRLIYFGYTSCPDACPLDLQKIAVALRRAGPAAARLPVLFITTDPKRDTPAKLKNYLQPFPRVRGLTGTPAQLAAVDKEYGVTVEIVWNRAKTDYMVNHTTFLYLIAPDGRLRDAFGSGDDASHIAASLRADLAGS